MVTKTTFEIIIIGASFSGLSAALALGRSLREVLIIDNEKPCNNTTPQSHNFITQDGKPPKYIRNLAKQQVSIYKTVNFYYGIATQVQKTKIGFSITTRTKNTFTSKKIIFATGLKDILPNILGFKACWGKTIIHCPYCHGYEIKNQETGILANGDMAFHFAKLVTNWTKKLTIFTNGTSTLTPEQNQKITLHNIKVIETKIENLKHNNGLLEAVIFKNEPPFLLKAMYARPNIEQHCNIPVSLGCEVTEQNLIKVNTMQETTIKGVYACGDNSSPLRAISHAVATGTIAGSAANVALIEQQF